MRVLDEFEETTQAALNLVGPRVVIAQAQVLRQAVRHAQRHDLENAALILGGARLDLEGFQAETAARHLDLGWAEIGRALGMSPRRARALYRTAGRDPEDARP